MAGWNETVRSLHETARVLEKEAQRLYDEALEKEDSSCKALLALQKAERRALENDLVREHLAMREKVKALRLEATRLLGPEYN